MHDALELADLTAHEMLAGYRAQRLSPVDVAEACLARIDAHNDQVNAFNYLDRERTREMARASAVRWRRGTPLGAVDGVPVAIKDMFVTHGMPNRKGSLVVDDAPGREDAPAVAALRRHGAVFMGRTTAPEFGWKGVTDSKLDGVTTNPWNPTKTAGGSSGGSAAAVPLGMATLALGTDAGGSIRIPAGFSGLVGLKPTHGVCPMWPPSAFYPLAHVGPMTWTVADTALLMNVLTEWDARDQTAAPLHTDFVAALDGGVRGLRIAYSPTLGFVDCVEPEIAAAVDATAEQLALLGASVDTCDPGFEDPLAAFDVLFYGGAANAMRTLSDADRARMDPGLVAVAAWAAELDLLDYLGAANVRAALLERMGRFHQRYDLLLTPSLPIPAFDGGMEVPPNWPHARWPTWTPFSYPFNLTGQPAVSVPCGFTKAGLPIACQLVGPRFADAVVLRAAHALERVMPWSDRRPRL